MDIKDFILIGGGLLIAAVVAHGFWIAWRARREPLRLDIVPNLFPDNVDDIAWLRGELPNGGARVRQRFTSGEQESLDLDDAPLLLEPTSREPEPEPASDSAPTVEQPVEPTVAAGRDLSEEGVIPESADIDEVLPESVAEPVVAEPVIAEPVVSEPVIAEPIVAEAPTPDPAPSEPPAEPAQRPQVTQVVVPEVQASAPEAPRSQPTKPARRTRRLAAKSDPDPVVATAAEAPPVEELLILNVLAPFGHRFTGAELFAAVRGKGLKFGDMNIFHRIDPLTKIVNYSVANVVEPGTFDVADMDTFRSPGLCFFMQLPGPEHPSDALDDMFEVASAVSQDLKGELKDEQRNFLTQQMVEHYRQRVMDFTRRRMSKRA